MEPEPLLNKKDVVAISDVLIANHTQILAMTPCTLKTVCGILLQAGLINNTDQAQRELAAVASLYPNIIIIETEKHVGQFLIYFHVEALKILACHESIDCPTQPTTTTEINELVFGSAASLSSMREAITKYTNSPTQMENMSLELLKEDVRGIPVTLICDSGSYEKCRQTGKTDCRWKLHLERVEAAHGSDPSDCSYLDTCLKGKHCKFVHYKTRMPDILPEIPLKQLQSDVGIAPAQYINADLHKFDLSLLGNSYKALIIDPPWVIHTNPGDTSGFSDNDVLNLHVEYLQTEGVVFLWVTGRALDIGRQCLAKWGYKHVEELIWLKTNQLGKTICTGRTGHWLNHTKEHVLVGVKGSSSSSFKLKRMLDTDVLVSTALGNSQKPEELYGIIERLVGRSAEKLELFGRRSNIRPGWLTLGKQLGATRITDPKLLKALKIRAA